MRTQRIFICVFFATVVWASRAHAVRTAIFPDEVRNRAIIWADQDKFFASESNSDRLRPMWVHAGDSISTGWASGSLLSEQLRRAEQMDLPQPGSVEDIFANVPQPKATWYAGSEVDHGGVFGYLERFNDRPWVLISTALAGALLSQLDSNPLRLPLEVRNPSRVKVVTFSLGGNDVCWLRNPFENSLTNPETNIKAMKEYFGPQAKIFAFAIPPVNFVYTRVRNRIAALPDSIGARRLGAYCQQAWENVNCPDAVSEATPRVEELRSRIHRAYADNGVQIIDTNSATNGMDVLDLLAGDCFHPSRSAQRIFYQETVKHLAPYLDR